MRLALPLLLLATSSSPPVTPGFPIGIVAWIFCNARKREQVGGWLLYFYWQLYGGLVMTVAFFVIAFQSYVPENFDNRNEYLLFLAATVPGLLVYVLQLAVATFLLSVRTWDMLLLLRALLVAQVAAAGISVLLNIRYFPDNVFFSVLNIAEGLLWLAYFFWSKRVRHVFLFHDWDVAVKSFYRPPPPSVI